MALPSGLSFLSSRNKPFPCAEMPIPTICSPLTPEWVSRARMTAVQHCHSSAMSRSAQPGCGLNAHSGRRCTPASRPSRSYSPAFSQLPPQSNPSQYCVMVYCTSSTAFSRSAPCGTSLTNMSRTWVPSASLKALRSRSVMTSTPASFIPSMIFC